MNQITVQQKAIMGGSSSGDVNLYVRDLLNTVLDSYDFVTFEEAVKGVVDQHKELVIDCKTNDEIDEEFMDSDSAIIDIRIREITKEIVPYEFSFGEIKPIVLEELIKMTEKGLVDCGIYRQPQSFFTNKYEGKGVWTKTDFFEDRIYVFKDMVDRLLHAKSQAVRPSMVVMLTNPPMKWPFHTTC